MPQVMPVEDAEISLRAKAVREAGHEDHLEAKVTKVEKGANSSPRHRDGKDGKREDHRRPHDLGRRRVAISRTSGLRRSA
jgi:pyruvate/2-oxoglutarate dehydrogenase complex dihydrolipoamide dehydrogenase (E3) component